MSLVEFERTDIYLSFLDEEIKDTFIINKKHFKNKQNIIISELEPKNITRISKRRFQTDKSLYLGFLYSASLGYSNNSYLIVKKRKNSRITFRKNA